MRIGEIEFGGPAATRLEIDEQQPVLRGDHLPGCGSPCSSCSAPPRPPVTRRRVLSVLPRSSRSMSAIAAVSSRLATSCRASSTRSVRCGARTSSVRIPACSRSSALAQPAGETSRGAAPTRAGHVRPRHRPHRRSLSPRPEASRTPTRPFLAARKRATGPGRQTGHVPAQNPTITRCNGQGSGARLPWKHSWKHVPPSSAHSALSGRSGDRSVQAERPGRPNNGLSIRRFRVRATDAPPGLTHAWPAVPGLHLMQRRYG
jgi:hypothetical protein